MVNNEKITNTKNNANTPLGTDKWHGHMPSITLFQVLGYFLGYYLSRGLT